MSIVNMNHVIVYYIEFCQKHLFNHLPESTLYQMLKGLKHFKGKV